MVLTSTTIVMLATLAITASELLTFRRTMIEELSTLADVVGASSSAALMFNDAQSAQEILSALNVKNNIISAELFLMDGTLLAEYLGNNSQFHNHAISNVFDTAHSNATASKSAPESLLMTQSDLLAKYIEVARPVIADDEIIGVVLIKSDMEALYETLRRYLKISMAVLFASILVAYFISSRLQGVISIPILRIKEAMNLVSRDKNYSLRVDKTSNDELGVLIVGFNEMLNQIQDRDQKLQRHREQLENQVLLRTMELSTSNHALENALKDMATAKEVAESANLAKSQFLAKMSHEIRTPMNGVLGMAELLMNTDLSPIQSRYAENVHKSGQALLHIINDILDLSKIEAGKLRLNIDEFNLRDLVEEAVELLAENAHSKGLDIACRLPVKLPLMFGDPIRIRQVIQNLTGNAIKFTVTGEVFVCVDVNTDSHGTIDFRISVKDSGIGIDDADQQQIFESFSQVDSSMARRYGGTGLGLTISKQLVELMGGSLHVKSKAGEGSVFWFDLILDKSPVITDVFSDLNQLNKFRVLVLDNSVMQQSIMQHYLESYGCNTTFVNTPAEAVKQLLDKSKPDDSYQVCIVSLENSPAHILELAHAIEKHSTLANLKLVTVSNLGSNIKLPDISRHVFNSLAKPIRQIHFYDAMCTALGLPALEKSTHDKSIIHRVVPSTCRLLIAEDNIVNREVAIEMLKSLGLTADVAANGFEVLNAMEQRDYDLILMDCQMPELDGFETTRLLRLHENKGNFCLAQQGVSPKAVIIVALTANAMSGDRDQCLDAGMNDYLSKPFSLQQLAMVLRRWLSIPVLSEEIPIQRVTGTRRTLTSELVATRPRQGTHLDQKVLNQIRSFQNNNGPSVLQKLINIYLDSTPVLLRELNSAIQSNSTKAIASIAHRLKSSSANLGAILLAEYFREIELFGRNKTLANISSLFSLALEEYKTVEHELKDLLTTS